MKKIILLTIIALTSMTSFAQVEKDESDISQNAQKSLLAVKYRLFPTENMWTFIKLNTRNGEMGQVQWSIEPEYRAIVPIE